MEQADLLSLWFGPTLDTPRPWDEIGRTLREDPSRRQGLDALASRAASGALDAWHDTRQGVLALALLTDGAPGILTGALMARANTWTREALTASTTPTHRAALAECLSRTEDLEDARLAFEVLTEIVRDPKARSARKTYKRMRYAAAKRMRALERFGRDPRHNERLGRTSTQAETSYLRAQEAASALPTPAPESRLRVLVLHPFRQSGARMEARAREALRKLEDLVDFVYLDAPNTYVPDAAQRVSILDTMPALPDFSTQRCWWNTDEDGGGYEGWEASVELVRTHLPVDGILGASQGSALAGLMASLAPERLRFVICVSGFVSRVHDIEPGSIALPSFHIYGERDELIAPERTLALADCFENPQLHAHERGHFAPSQWPIDALREFLSGFLDAPLEPALLEPSWVEWLSSSGDRPELPDAPEAQRALLRHAALLGPEHLEKTAALWAAVWEIAPEVTEAALLENDNWPLLKELACLRAKDPAHVDRIAARFVRALREVQDGELSEVAVHAPRQRSRAERVSGLATAIATDLWPERQGRAALAHYRRLIVAGTRAYRDAQERARAPWVGRSADAPISEEVLHPKPVPVTPCPPEELAPLLGHLRLGQREEEDVAFARGTLTSDGRLDLCKQVVGPLGISPLLSALELHPHVDRLLLGNNIVGATGAHAIAEFLRSGKSRLKVWYIAGNDLTAETLAPLTDALTASPEVEGLWLKRNPLGPGAGPVLRDLLQRAPHLRTLDLVNTGLLDDGALPILQALLENTTLETLFLGTNGLTERSARALGEVLGASRSLRSVYLGCNRIGDAGAEAIAAGLKDNIGLEHLGLASNRISAHGTEALCEAIAGHGSLRFLDLGWARATNAVGELGNELGMRGAQALARMLEGNQVLEGLDVSHTLLPQAGLDVMGESIERSGRLTYLKCPQFGRELGPVAMARLRDRMQANRVARGVPEEVAAHVRLPQAARDVLSVYRTEPIIG